MRVTDRARAENVRHQESKPPSAALQRARGQLKRADATHVCTNVYRTQRDDGSVGPWRCVDGHVASDQTRWDAQWRANTVGGGA